METNRLGITPKPYNKFKAYLVEKGIRQKEVADIMQISLYRFNSKINRNNADFTPDEIRLLCQKYDLDANEYFFYE